MNKLEIPNLKKLKAILGLSAVLTSATLTGCESKTVVEDATKIYDTIDSEGENVEIKPQVLDVPGEDFKLVVEYGLDANTKKKWRITDTKKLDMKVYTQGLPEGMKVYIDNVHTDTSIIASNELMNGIPQDSMDDRIHNSLMIGFPISDEISLKSTNVIEGQNDDFIRGSFYGFNSYQSGEIEQERYTEEMYLKNGVYANLISSSYGLLIQKGDQEPYGVDISSDIVVLVYNKITKKDEHGNISIVEYDRDGSYTETKVKVKK